MFDKTTYSKISGDASLVDVVELEREIDEEEYFDEEVKDEDILHGLAVEERASGSTRIVVREGTVVEGNLSFDNPVCIEGKLIGSVRSDNLVIVAASALVEGAIESEAALINGYVEGNVKANHIVKVFEGGCLVGDVYCGSLMVEPGAMFCGMCNGLRRR